ncbi:MAG: lysylphosphatidylglycerol synthase domain-containing protein [archaeon]
MKNKLLKSLKVIVTVIVIVFLFDFIFKNWNKTNFTDLSLNPTYLILSILIFSTYMFLYSALWWKLLRTLNAKISLQDTNRIYSVSNFYRYIPGRVALLVGRIFLCSKKGVEKWKTALSLALEIVLLTIAAVGLFVATLVLYSPYTKLTKASLIIAVGIAMVIVVHPILLKSLTTVIIKLTKIKDITSIKYKSLSWITFAYLLIWILQGTGFYLIISALHDTSIALLPICIGIFAISWAIGYLGILSPGGIGIREGAIVLLGSQFIPVGAIIAASVLSRLIITFSEIIFWAVTKVISTSPKE